MTHEEIRKQLTKAQADGLRFAANRKPIGDAADSGGGFLARELTSYMNRFPPATINKLICLGLLEQRLRVEGNARDRLIERQVTIINEAQSYLSGPARTANWKSALDRLRVVAEIDHRLDQQALVVTDLGVEVVRQ